MRLKKTRKHFATTEAMIRYNKRMKMLNSPKVQRVRMEMRIQSNISKSLMDKNQTQENLNPEWMIQYQKELELKKQQRKNWLKNLWKRIFKRENHIL